MIVSDLVWLFLFILAMLLIAFLILFVLFLLGWAINSLPALPRTIRIRRRLKELRATGFAPTQEFVGAGVAIALDSRKRKIFLANKRAMKLFDLEDIKKIETNFKADQFGISSAMYITVQDLESPFFVITAAFTNKLRVTCH